VKKELFSHLKFATSSFYFLLSVICYLNTKPQHHFFSSYIRQPSRV